MASQTNLTNSIAFQNIVYIEDHEKTEIKQVHGFGVRGNKFVFIKKSNSFLSRIWFSILKAFRIIKIDQKLIDALKQKTLLHIKTDDYKKWSLENAKITKLGLKNLIDRNEFLELNHINDSKKITEVENLQKAGKQNASDKKKLEAKIKTLENQIKLYNDEIKELKAGAETVPETHDIVPNQGFFDKKIQRLEEENKKFKKFIKSAIPEVNIHEVLKSTHKKPEKTSSPTTKKRVKNEKV